MVRYSGFLNWKKQSGFRVWGVGLVENCCKLKAQSLT